MSSKNQQGGYTLTEILIVVVILGLLTVLVTVSLSGSLSVGEARGDRLANWIRTVRERIFTDNPSTSGINNNNSSSETTKQTSSEKSDNSSVSKNSQLTFSSSYQISSSTQKDGTVVGDIKIEITPLDLANGEIKGIKIDLSAQGLPTANEAYAKINAGKSDSNRDWTCQLGPIIICQGPTVLEVNKKSTFDLFFTESLTNTPANLTVGLLESQTTIVNLSLPLQNP